MITRRDFVRTNEGDRNGRWKGEGLARRLCVNDTRQADKRSINLIFEIYIGYCPLHALFLHSLREISFEIQRNTDRRDEVYRSKMGEARRLVI